MLGMLCETDESLMLTANMLDKRECVTLYKDDRLVSWWVGCRFSLFYFEKQSNVGISGSPK